MVACSCARTHTGPPNFVMNLVPYTTTVLRNVFVVLLHERLRGWFCLYFGFVLYSTNIRASNACPRMCAICVFVCVLLSYRKLLLRFVGFVCFYLRFVSPPIFFRTLVYLVVAEYDCDSIGRNWSIFNRSCFFSVSAC